MSILDESKEKHETLSSIIVPYLQWTNYVTVLPMHIWMALDIFILVVHKCILINSLDANGAKALCSTHFSHSAKSTVCVMSSCGQPSS